MNIGFSKENLPFKRKCSLLTLNRKWKITYKITKEQSASGAGMFFKKTEGEHDCQAVCPGLSEDEEDLK